jgi:hypothetical protein
VTDTRTETRWAFTPTTLASAFYIDIIQKERQRQLAKHLELVGTAAEVFYDESVDERGNLHCAFYSEQTP